MWRASLAKVYDNVVTHCEKLSVPKSEKMIYSVDYEEPAMSAGNLNLDLSVINEDAIEAALQLDNPLVLNLASPTRPGGGVRAGALAQEEELFRRTAYHKTLHLETGFYPLKDDEVIYSPNVPVVNNCNYEFNQTAKTVSFIACAGLRWPPSRNGKHYANAGDRETVRKKIKTILGVAFSKGHTNLVLGALGCGCFRSPPFETALLFKECLNAYNSVFDKVAFAILDRETSPPNLGLLATTFANVLLPFPELPIVVKPSYLQTSLLGTNL